MAAGLFVAHRAAKPALQSEYSFRQFLGFTHITSVSCITLFVTMVTMRIHPCL